MDIEAHRAEAKILWAETLDSIGAAECAEIIADAERSGELWQHWSNARYRGGVSEGSGERGELRARIARDAALHAGIATGMRSIERMGSALWASTWRYDYAGAAERLA